jgi:hypothetical protein
MAKKALCIGINYIGTDHELQGCINDSMNVRSLLINQYQIPTGNITLLTDSPSSLPMFQPTKAIIIQYMKDLVSQAQKGDTLFISYSGHGSLISGTEDVMCPLDFDTNGFIDNLQIHSLLVSPLPLGVSLVALMDCCQSGTLFDLPYTYQSKSTIKDEITKEIKKIEPQIHFLRRNTKVQSASKAKNGDVFLFSGCKDNQYSLDTADNGNPCGAMTDCFIKVLSATPKINYVNLLLGIRKAIDQLTNNYPQTPQLSSNNKGHIFNIVNL